MEVQFQTKRGELQRQVLSLHLEVDGFRHQLATMEEGTITCKREFHGKRRELQLKLPSLHRPGELYQRQYVLLQEQV